MAIPAEIRKVPRPANTVVYAYGKNKDRYGVKKRIGCVRKNGKNYPVNGPTVGRIINGKYVPLEELKDSKPTAAELASQAIVELKDWGDVVFCDHLLKPILEELKQVYNISDALRIYCICILRVCNPGIKDYELKEAYETSFLSELYPGLSLCRNSVSKFLSDLGKAYSKIVEFMRLRVQQVPGDHRLLVDGTLKSNESKINSLSDYSRKAKLKGSRDISVMFAFDLESMEPVCSKCYPGNMIDQRAFEDFIEENKITRGLIVADKGFSASSCQNFLDQNQDLHLLTPIRRNSKAIEKLGLQNYDGVIGGRDQEVQFKKTRSKAGKWYYAFRDPRRAGKEERDWITNARRKGYSDDDYKAKVPQFGTIILETDLDLPPKTVYKAYEKRWEIELVMRFYKHACMFDETRVHSDYSVYGSELCDFLATVLTYRLLNSFDKVGIDEEYTYKRTMKLLNRAKKLKVAGEDWKLIRQTVKSMELLEKLGILEQKTASKGQEESLASPLKRKPGRPRKNSS